MGDLRMTNHKTLIILYTLRQAKIALRKNMISGKEIVFVMDTETSLFLHNKGIPHKILNNYLNDSLFSNIDKDAMKFAKMWYKVCNLQHFVQYDRYNLGELIEWEMSYYFSLVFEIIRILKYIIEKEDPSEIIVFEDWSGYVYSVNPDCYEDIPVKVATLLGKIRGIPVKKIEIRDHEKSIKSSSYLNISGKQYTKIIAISILSKLLNIFRKLQGHSRYKLLCLDSWDNVREVAMYLPDVDFIFLESGLNRKLLKEVLIRPFKYRVSFVSYERHLNHKIETEVQHYKEYIKLKWDAFKDSNKKPALYYSEIDIWPVVESRLDYIFLTFFPAVIRRIRLIENLLIKKKINLVLLPNDVTHEMKTIAKVAKNLGIKSLVIQHGYVGHPIGFLPLTADKIAVWGKKSKEFFIQNGVDKSRIVITGCPRFDRYIKGKVPSKNKVCKELGINPNEKIVVLATQHANRGSTFANVHIRDDEFEKIVKIVIDATKELSDYQLVIKLHPSDNKVEVHKQIIFRITSNLPKEIKQRIFVVQHVDISKILSICDVLITFTSTTGLEAMILKKPIITIHLENKNVINYYSLMGGVLVCRTKDELKKALERISLDETFKNSLIRKYYKHIYDHLYMLDGMASKRIANLIVSLIENLEG